MPAPGSCLTATDNGPIRFVDADDGDPDSDDQLWQKRDDGLVNVAYERCLDGGASDGVSIRDRDTNDFQSWQLRTVE